MRRNPILDIMSFMCTTQPSVARALDGVFFVFCPRHPLLPLNLDGDAEIRAALFFCAPAPRNTLLMPFYAAPFFFEWKTAAPGGASRLQLEDFRVDELLVEIACIIAFVLVPVVCARC